MWANCGIVRNLADLKKADVQLEALSLESQEFKRRLGISSSVVELDNMISVGHAMVKSAASRHESRGGHFLVEYPEKRSSFEKPTVLNKRSTA